MRSIKKFFFTLFLILTSFFVSIFFSALLTSALPNREPPRENIPSPLTQLNFPQTKEGILKVENDFSSPIFYDFDDSTYFLNPSAQEKSGQLAGWLDLNNNQIKEVADPVDCQDVATKNYVDKVFRGEISPTCL